MKLYEYIRLVLDLGDLGDLNSLAGCGWRVVAVIGGYHNYYALLERELGEEEK